jgi:endonuclease/exonuclease/phosphatase family metal-dependent hydrolase
VHAHDPAARAPLRRFLWLVGLALPGVAQAIKRKPAKVTVMTRNIYFGADISNAVFAESDARFRRYNGALWRMVRKTNFPARAKLLAREISKTKPDLIGLQEVALWRRSRKGVVEGPATIVKYDFLKSIQRALKARHLKYRVGSVQREADFEGPTSQNFAVRLTVRDVVLVKRKRGLKVKRRGGANFKARLELPTVAGHYTARFGFAYVDATYRKRKLRFIDTHLEAFDEPTRLAQAQELVAKGGPTDTERRVILVGDMNSDPKDRQGAEPSAYDAIRRAGLRDAWITIKGRKAKGFTCCLWREDITDRPPAPFGQRIDHIFTKPRLRGTRAVIVGRNRKNRTARGLWPSDHGGWAATLLLP